MGMTPLLTSWIESLPNGVSQHSALLTEIFAQLVPEGIRFVRKALKETVATVDHNLCLSAFRLFDALVRPFRRSEVDDPLTAEELVALEKMVAPLFVFAIIWSVGASCDKNGRAKFDEFLRNALKRVQGVRFVFKLQLDSLTCFPPSFKLQLNPHVISLPTRSLSSAHSMYST